METPERGALTLVRLIGAVFLLWTVFDLGLYLAKCWNPKHPVPVETVTILLHSIPAIVGCLILIKAKAIADWIADWFDN